MDPHTRAMVAAAAFAFLTGKKVGGLYDHSAKRDLKIAAECRGGQLQGFDGERQAKFSGAPPELYDDGDRSFVSFEIEGTRVQGYDRRSASSYTVELTDGLVQLYDHSQLAWFAYDMQDVDADRSYHRVAE